MDEAKCFKCIPRGTHREVQMAELCEMLPLGISGRVAYYQTAYPPVSLSSKLISGVSMTLSGQAGSSTYTGTDGAYSFPLLSHGSYQVSANFSLQDFPATKGITVSDAGLIQSYILGHTTFTPYQLLAADVDGNGVIDQADLNLINDMILGKIASFPAGSWRIVPYSYVFPNPAAPWNAPNSISETLTVNPVTDADFMLIKLGDVNANWTP